MPSFLPNWLDTLGTSSSARQSGFVGLGSQICHRSDGTMKKHSREEILLKLGQADELARAGKSQVEICKTLGVSVMTFHRWRKLPSCARERTGADRFAEEPTTAAPSTMAEMAPRS